MSRGKCAKCGNIGDLGQIWNSEEHCINLLCTECMCAERESRRKTIMSKEHEWEDICVTGVGRVNSTNLKLDIDISKEPDGEDLEFILLSKSDLAVLAAEFGLVLYPKDSEIKAGG